MGWCRWFFLIFVWQSLQGSRKQLRVPPPLPPYVGSLKGRSVDIFCFHYICSHLFFTHLVVPLTTAMLMTHDFTFWLNLKTSITLPPFMTVLPLIQIRWLKSNLSSLWSVLMVLPKEDSHYTDSLASNRLGLPIYSTYTYIWMHLFLSYIWATLKL